MVTLCSREVSERELFKVVILNDIAPRSASLCKFALELLYSLPSYFWVDSASSSGKTHPIHDFGDGGLARHSLMTYRWLKALMEGSPVELNECASAMIIAALFHDCCKRGLPDQPRSERTMFEHPLLGAKFIMDKSIEFIDKNRDFIETTSDDEDWFKEQVAIIASCVQSHMGKWNTSKWSADIVLPIPKNSMQYLVHLADYCASRKFTMFDVTFFNDIMLSKGENK